MVKVHLGENKLFYYIFMEYILKAKDIKWCLWFFYLTSFVKNNTLRNSQLYLNAAQCADVFIYATHFHYQRRSFLRLLEIGGNVFLPFQGISDF